MNIARLRQETEEGATEADFGEHDGALFGEGDVVDVYRSDAPYEEIFVSRYKGVLITILA